MAFPTTVTDYATHSEGGADYYGLHGDWRRKRLPQFVFMGDSTSPTNCIAAGHFFFGMWLPAARTDIDRPRNMIVCRAAFTTATNTDVTFRLYDRAAGDYIPKAKYQDPSGVVRWGDGGFQTDHWKNSAGWSGTEFPPGYRDGTRKILAGKPQLLQLWLTRMGTNNTVVAWRFYSQCVTSSVLISNFVKMNVTVDLTNIAGLTLALDSGNFTDGRISTEIY
jgi:hypothetical protein